MRSNRSEMRNETLSKLDFTPVSELMNAHVEKIAQSESIYAAVHQMLSRNIGSVAVIPDDAAGSNQIVGLLPVYQTLPQLLSASQGRDVPVKDVMFTNAITIPVDATLRAALEKITSNQSWRLIVVDSRGEPVGILSATDIMKWLVRTCADRSEAD